MGKKLSLDWSPTGVQHYVEISDDELITVEHTPDVVEKHILDGNHVLREHLLPNTKSAFRHAARIPIQLWQSWRAEWEREWSDVYDWGTFEIMKLNSTDYKKLRTTVNQL